MHSKKEKIMSRRLMLSFLLAAILLMSSVITVGAAAPSLKGTITSPQGQGTISFVAVKAMRNGYQGNFVVYGKTYPGVLYAIGTTGNVGLVWFYGSSGLEAGSAVISPTGTGRFNGPAQFFDRKGNLTQTGTVDATIQ